MTQQLALLTPTEDFPNQKIRSELNLEKWSFWTPAQSRLKPAEIIRERLTTLPDGSTERARVAVQSVGKLGLFTTEDQKTYYALIKLWEEKGKPDGSTGLSIRQLAHLLKKGWGSKVLKSLTESLLRLRTIPFIWENSYYNAATGETEEILTAFTILSDLKLHRTRKDGHVNKEQGYFKFNAYILQNLLANYTKPLYLDVILAFQSEIAQLLYTYLDLIMADKTVYERRSAGLFSDLGLEGKTYRNPSDRKRKLVKALAEIRGVPLSTGILTSAAIKPTKDQIDFKVVFRKQPVRKGKAGQSAADLTENEADAEEPVHAAVEADIMAAATDLVRDFHQQLGRPAQKPGVKEIRLAAQWLVAYGYEQARYMLDYALQAARQTNFSMRTFGALRQYEQDATAAYIRQQQARAASRQLQFTLPAPPDPAAQQKQFEQMYQALDPEAKAQLQTRAEQRLRGYKQHMTAAAYTETLKYTIRQELLRELGQQAQ